MLAFAIVAVFVAGLMVGRTPEYMGKKIESYEMKMATLMVLIPPFVVKIGTAIAVATAAGQSAVLNPGPHGFSEILYAFSSTANNNGSAFAGLGTNTTFYNIILGIAMLLGRYWLAVPALAIAGSLAAKKSVPAQRRHPPHAHAALHRVAGGGGRHRRRAELLPRAGARAYRRTPADLPVSAMDTTPIAQPAPSPAPGPRPASGHERREMESRRGMYRRAVVDSFVKLNPRNMVGNPVMFVVEVGSVLTTVLLIQAIAGTGEAAAPFIGAVAALLWLTVLFANFSQALAEGRGKARAEALRRTRQQTQAKRVGRDGRRIPPTFPSTTRWSRRPTCTRTTSTSPNRAT